MNYQVMPGLTPEEFEGLKADIAQHGVLVPVEMDETGNILDGHHRVQAWQELRDEGVTLPDYPRMVRSGMTEEAKRNHARRLNVMRRQLSREQRDEVMRAMRADGMTYKEIAQAVGVSVNTAYRLSKETDLFEIEKVVGAEGKSYPATYAPRAEPAPALFVPGGAVTLDPVAARTQVKQERQEIRAARRVERVDKINAISRGNAPLATVTSYPVIYADPPWRYEHSRTDNRQIENHYPTMDLTQICALPVGEVAAPDAVLFLWATSPIANGHTLYVDEKKRAKDYSDILLEYVSISTIGAPGWMEKDLSIDYLAYAFMPSRRVHLFPWLMLQRAWQHYKNEWIRKFRTIKAQNNGYETWSIAVPVDVVRTAVSLASIIDVSVELAGQNFN